MEWSFTATGALGGLFFAESALGINAIVLCSVVVWGDFVATAKPRGSGQKARRAKRAGDDSKENTGKERPAASLPKIA